MACIQILGALGTIVAMLAVVLHSRVNLSKLKEIEYDYIIVGSGTAGSIVAAELIKTGSRVLILEAGQRLSWTTRVVMETPLLASVLLSADSASLWKYETEPQDHAGQFMQNRKLILISGKTLGGSSMISAMIKYTSTARDFDSWNIPEWNYSSLRPVIESEFTCGLRSTKMSNDTKMSKLSSIFDALHNFNLDGHILKFDRPELFFDGSRRVTSFSDCLEPLLSESNVDLLTDFTVHKVDLHGDSAQKTGISVTGNSGSQRLKLRLKQGGKVVLSAGTIESARIIANSDISHQSSASENIYEDHPIFGVFFNVTLPSGLATMDDVLSVGEASRYLFKGKGLWTVPSGLAAVGYLHPVDGGNPSVQYYVIGLAAALVQPAIKWLSNFMPGLWNRYIPPRLTSSTEGFILISVLLRPHSHGLLRWTADGHSRISSGLLTDQRDVEHLRRGFRAVTTALTSTKGQAWARPHWPRYPGCGDATDSDDYLDCLIRGSAITAYHMVGSNAMGRVTDIDLRLKGTKNVFVVDASVIPHIPAGNPIHMISVLAHRGADIIKNL